MHQTRIRTILETWGHPQRFTSPLRFFSDDDDPLILASQVTKCEGCSKSKDGIPCRTSCLLRELYREFGHSSRAPKWYIRAIDDTLVALPNMLHHLAHIDHTKPVVVGDFFYGEEGDSHERPAHCTYPLTDTTYSAECYTYPAGGCGWAISAAAMAELVIPQLELYNTIHQQYLRMGEGAADDYYFGRFMAVIGLPPQEGRYSCFSQSPALLTVDFGDKLPECRLANQQCVHNHTDGHGLRLGAPCRPPIERPCALHMGLAWPPSSPTAAPTSTSGGAHNDSELPVFADPRGHDWLAGMGAAAVHLLQPTTSASYHAFPRMYWVLCRNSSSTRSTINSSSTRSTITGDSAITGPPTHTLHLPLDASPNTPFDAPSCSRLGLSDIALANDERSNGCMGDGEKCEYTSARASKRRRRVFVGLPFAAELDVLEVGGTPTRALHPPLAILPSAVCTVSYHSHLSCMYHRSGSPR
jgi:hypothetical protein